MAMPHLAVQALGLIVSHLKQFGLERVLCLGASFRPFSSNMEMTLSANALQQLEVSGVVLPFKSKLNRREKQIQFFWINSTVELSNC